MKMIKAISCLLALFAVTMFLVSCEDDGGGTGGGGNNDGYPNVSITGMETQTVSIGDTVYLTVNATKGDSPLKTISVQENDSKLPLNRVLYDGVSSANPLLLTETSKDAFEKKIGIIASQGVATNNYSILIADEDGKSVKTDLSITTTGTPPSISFTSSMSGDVTTKPNSLQSYPISATVGSGELRTITVYENDEILDQARVEFAGQKENPITLTDADKNGFSNKTLFIRTNETQGTNSYKVVIADEFGIESVLNFSITTEEPNTPVTEIMGVLFNQAGPAGTGGLDLDNGKGTGSSDENAEIKDLGLDNTQSYWQKKIAPVNGSSISYIKPGQNGVAENFDFSSITSVEEIASLASNGVAYNEEEVQKGNIFLVQRDGKNYLIQIVAINETSNDNKDNYEIDIRF